MRGSGVLEHVLGQRQTPEDDAVARQLEEGVAAGGLQQRQRDHLVPLVATQQQHELQQHQRQLEHQQTDLEQRRIREQRL